MLTSFNHSLNALELRNAKRAIDVGQAIAETDLAMILPIQSCVSPLVA